MYTVNSVVLHSRQQVHASSILNNKRSNKNKVAHLGSDVLESLVHVSEHVFGLPGDAVVLHLVELAVVVLQLPLQLLDGLRRLLVLLLEHLLDARTLLLVSVVGQLQVLGHVVVARRLLDLDLFGELEDLLLELGNGLLGSLGVRRAVHHIEPIAIRSVREGVG